MKQEKNEEVKRDRCKKKPKDDILEVVKQFINYFEAADRSGKNDNSI